MPSIITHHVFSEDLYDKLDLKIKNKINKSKMIYNTFAQSHDYLFYCRLDLKNGKKINELGQYAHRHKTQKYLINIIKNIKNLNLENNSEALGYLYGSITHYVLDSTCHPYIFYKGGAWNKDDKNTYKYRGEHNHIEKDLDAIYYKKYYKKDYKYCNITKDIIKNPQFSNQLKKLIDNSYKDTYNIENISQFYIKGIDYCKKTSSILINDRFGIKRIIYKIIDLITYKNFGMLSCFSTHLNPDMKWLNNDHETWNNPCNIDLKYNYSFEELYNQSINKCLNIIKKCNDFFNKKISIEELEKNIPNISYTNGLLEEEYVPMRHFEY